MKEQIPAIPDPPHEAAIATTFMVRSPKRTKWVVPVVVASVGVIGVVVGAIATPLFAHVNERYVGPAIDQVVDGAFDPNQPFDVDLLVSGGSRIALPDPLDDPNKYGPLLAGDYDHGGFDEFISGLEGRPVHQLFVKLVLTAGSGHDFAVLGMRPVVLEVLPPLSGTLILKPEGGMGGEDVTLSADLDTPENGFVTPEGDPYFQQNTVAIAEHDSQVFNMMFTADRSAYRWLIEVTFLGADGEINVVTVDAEGTVLPDEEGLAGSTPFEVTASADSYTHSFESNYYHSGPGYVLVAP